MNTFGKLLTTAAIVTSSILWSGCRAEVNKSDAITDTFAKVVPEGTNLPADITREINKNAVWHPKKITKAVIEKITKMLEAWEEVNETTIFGLFRKEAQSYTEPLAE